MKLSRTFFDFPPKISFYCIDNNNVKMCVCVARNLNQINLNPESECIASHLGYLRRFVLCRAITLVSMINFRNLKIHKKYYVSIVFTIRLRILCTYI